jgi:ribonuclease HII
MEDLHLQFPMYDWINNKGYGTAKHRKAIEECGVCKHHRLSFNILPKQIGLVF